MQEEYLQNALSGVCLDLSSGYLPSIALTAVEINVHLFTPVME